MDRASFLSCLPFLSPEIFASWPPPTACSKSQPFDGTHADVSSLNLEQYRLSIEPRCSNAEATTLGPACFASPQATKLLSDGVHEDSSICEFQMTVVLPSNQNNKSSPSGSVSTSGTGTTTSQSPKTPLRTTANTGIAFHRSHTAVGKFFVRIDDKHCFRMDMRQLEKMEVPDLAGDGSKGTTSQKPPCLLLIYPTCCFRIFSIQKDRNSTQKELEMIYHQLQTCWTAICFHREGMVGGIFPHADWTSSFGTSSGSSGGHGNTSSNEAGQRHATTATTAGVAAANPSHGQDNQKQVQGDGKAASRFLRQRQKCYAKSQEGLKSLNAVLDMPAWIWEESDPKRRRLVQEGDVDVADEQKGKGDSIVLRDHLSDSLCSAADHLSASFWVNSNEKNQYAQFYETKLKEHEDEMEQVLTEAFPRSHRGRFPASNATSPETVTGSNRRHRKTGSSPLRCSAPSPAQAGTPAVTQDPNHAPSTRRQLLLQAKKTIKQQRQAVVGRHKLSLLPTRW